MSNKTDFQARVLKKYGVIPVFEGEPKSVNVRTSEPGETFKQWCARVLGKRNDEVSLFCLRQPKGNERIGRLGLDGNHLKNIVQAQSRKSFLKGIKQSEVGDGIGASDDWLPVKNRLISQGELYDALADAVPDRSEAIDQFFQRFSDQYPDEDWANLFENLAKEYAKLAALIKEQGDVLSDGLKALK